MTSATPTRQLLARPERMASILRGAASAFAKSGFAATSMEDVAAACGVTKLIVYRHFESKEDLYRAVLQRVFDRQAEEFMALLATTGKTRGVSARAFLVVAREDPDGFVLFWRHAARESQFADYAREHRAIVAAAARQLMAADLGDETIERWASDTAVGFLVEGVLAWLEHGSASRDDEVIERITNGLVALRHAWFGSGR